MMKPTSPSARGSASPVAGGAREPARAVVARAVSTRGAVQVLGGILLRGERRPLELAATDMELSLRTTVAGDGRGRGRGRRAGRSCSATSCGCCRRRGHDRRTGRRTGVAAIDVRRVLVAAQHLRAEDFPRLPDRRRAAARDRAARRCSTRSQRVSRAASRDESRPVLTGILVRFEGGQLTMAATDSYRMAVKETELASAGAELEAIIPARALDELGRIAAGADERPARRQREPRRSSAPAALADDAADRRAVPELRAAAAGDASTSSSTCRAASCSRSSAARRVMAQRNTPLRLRFARAS